MGNNWIIESVKDRTVEISGYDEMNITKSWVTIGYNLPVNDPPDGETNINCANKYTILGESANSLLSENQMEENGIIMQQTMDGRIYPELDG